MIARRVALATKPLIAPIGHFRTRIHPPGPPRRPPGWGARASIALPVVA